MVLRSEENNRISRDTYISIVERLDPDRDQKLRYIKVRSIVNMLIKIVLVNEGFDSGVFARAGISALVGWLVGEALVRGKRRIGDDRGLEGRRGSGVD